MAGRTARSPSGPRSSAEAAREAREHVGHGQPPRRGRDQLDGQREPVEEAAQVADEAQLGHVGRAAAPAALEEQPDGWRAGQLVVVGVDRRHLERFEAQQGVTRQPEGLAGGHQHAHAGRPGEDDLHAGGNLGRDVLAGVEHQQRGAVAQVRPDQVEGVGGAVLGRVGEPEARRQQRRHERRARCRRELDQPHAVGVVDHGLARDLDGQAGLAAPARPDDGHQAAAGEELARVVHLGGTSHQGRGRDRQAAALHRTVERGAERGVLEEDAVVEVAQGRTGLDAELLGQHLTGTAEGPQRLGLPATAVERQHQLLPATLAQGLRLGRGRAAGRPPWRGGRGAGRPRRGPPRRPAAAR